MHDWSSSAENPVASVLRYELLDYRLEDSD